MKNLIYSMATIALLASCGGSGKKEMQKMPMNMSERK